ncbi:hypothetical protein [Weissella cibaria]|uniref:hypothetical protein n=1 Tax=Weissella cibaria TaxID=137591 RepID=UPI0034E8D13C
MKVIEAYHHGTLRLELNTHGSDFLIAERNGKIAVWRTTETLLRIWFRHHRLDFGKVNVDDGN